MTTIHVSDERQDFTDRLRQALRNADYSPDSPTQLAREFNIRFAGRAITVHAARKWLIGEAIPTQDKLRTLAQWLGVAGEWLRFGGEEKEAIVASSHDRIPSRDLAIIESLQRLDDQQRHIVRGVIRLLIQTNARK